MSRLTRDGTAEPVSRDQILRNARGQGNIIFPVQLTTSRIGLDPYSAICDDHTYIHTCIHIATASTAITYTRYNRMDQPGKVANPTKIIIVVNQAEHDDD